MNSWITREDIWSQLDREWDVIVIGGGITGAGIFNLSSGKGLRTLLIEQKDFAYGTSSRSSKLVHGGLRYLKNHQYGVTFESVKERERLLTIYPYLVRKVPFIWPNFVEYEISSWQVKISLFLYDLFAQKHQHGQLSRSDFEKSNAIIRNFNLKDIYFYHDAVVDDARLVFRTINEGIKNRGFAINYAKVENVLLDKHNKVRGVSIIDAEGKLPSKEVEAKFVINAADPWSDDIRQSISDKRIIRKLRGSHLLFTNERIPISNGLLMFHPQDKRAIFAIP